MPTNVPTWWTDDRVEATVNREYVYSQLRADEQELLKKSPAFADGLTDDTYLDWIVTKSRRFFLTLVDAGVPDQIFGILDDSYDDGDLPIGEESLPDLHLSYEPNPTLNRRFYKAQYRYLLRILEDGEHIRYADEETVPVYATGLKATILSLGKDDVDRVRLSASVSRYYVRKKINVDHRPGGTSEVSVLEEIASLRRYAHPHLLSVFASYLQHDSIYVLFTPAPAYSLKSFLSDVPKAFDHLSKSQKRKTLLSWTHCLASALRWLHTNGRHHGAIRPSNIQVTDDDFHLYLGQFDDPGVLGTHTKTDDLESYQYAAPERWKRAVTMQTTAPSKVMGTSGGRTARRIKPEKTKSDDSSSNRSPRSSWSSEQRRVDTMNPTSTTYSFMPRSRGNFTRLQLSKSNDTAIISDGISTMRPRANTADWTTAPDPRHTSQSNTRSQIPSAMSNVSSGSNRTIKPGAKYSGFAAAPEIKTTVVQTWASAQHNLLAADVFSMGAVMMDIATLLCKKGAGNFARHRSAKNRNAGRGGGLADASYHANLGQVIIWGSQLQNYAADKAKKDDGLVFKALAPIIQLVKRCLEREPEDRLTSINLERRLGEYITTFAGADCLHCSPAPTLPKKEPASISLAELRLAEEASGSIPEGEQPPIGSGYPPSHKDQWSQLRSRGLTTTTIPSPDPKSSLSSLSSFNFEYDVQSETVIGEDRSVIDESTRTSDSHNKDHSFDPHELGHRLYAEGDTKRRWNNWHNNDSSVDPQLTIRADSKSFTYADYHSAESSSEAEGSQDHHQGDSFLLPPSRPTSMNPGMSLPSPPPTRALPAAPNSSRQRSGAGTRGGTVFQPRTSSLQPQQGEFPRRERLEEEDFQALSLKNSAAPQERRHAKRPGNSFSKNL